MTTTMHTIFSRLTILAAGVAALTLAAASCSKTSVDGGTLTAGDGEYVMTIDPTVDGSRAAADTREKLITDEAGLRTAGFGMSVYNGSSLVEGYGNLTMEYQNSSWKEKKGKPLKWPGNTSYKFLAWSPATLTGITTTGGGFSSFTYNGISDQTDIMLGYYQGTGTPDGTNCKAPIKFSHPLASVQFQVGTMNGLSRINSIKISGVLPQGTCTVTTATPPTYSWSGITGTAVEISQSGLTVSPTTSGTAIGTPFLVLPQALSSNNITVTLNVTPTTGSAKNITLTLNSNTLAAGKTTVYNINYYPKSGLNFSTPVVSSWGNSNRGNIIFPKPTPKMQTELVGVEGTLRGKPIVTPDDMAEAMWLSASDKKPYTIEGYQTIDMVHININKDADIRSFTLLHPAFNPGDEVKYIIYKWDGTWLGVDVYVSEAKTVNISCSSECDMQIMVPKVN